MRIIDLIKELIPQWYSLSQNSGAVKIGNILIQWGENSQSVSSAADVNWNTTFVKAYAQTPTVFAQVVDTQTPNAFSVVVNNVTNTGCTFRRRSTLSASYVCRIFWLAIGKAA